MADRVYPSGDHETASSTQNSSEHPLTPIPPSPEKPVPPPGTYVIQIPKDQVYRVPPPENAHRFQNYTRRKPSRSRCRFFLCCLLSSISILTILAGISAAVLYLVFRPESPNFSVDSIAINGINATASSPEITPAIDVVIRAENPNNKLGIFYRKQSSVTVFYSDVELCDGVMPAFYQPANNVTALKTALTGPGIQLTAEMKKSLSESEKQGKVPLKLKMKAPVKFKVGSVKTWTVAVKLGCDLTVDKLTAEAKIVSKSCDYSWKLWW